MPINCEFNLSRAAAIYYNGEQISGSLTVTVDGKKSFKLEGKMPLGKWVGLVIR